MFSFVPRCQGLLESAKKTLSPVSRTLRKARCNTNRMGRTVAAVHTIETPGRPG